VSQNKGKYYFSKVAVISADEKVRNDAKTFFDEYVFPHVGISNFSADTFSTQDDAFNVVKTANEQPYCFAVNFDTFDLVNNNFKIKYSWNKNSIPDTNLDDYNTLLLAPDLASWGLWFDDGPVSLYIYMTEFIARAKSGSSMSGKEPLYTQ
jgi:hypothetical protein